MLSKSKRMARLIVKPLSPHWVGESSSLDECSGLNDRIGPRTRAPLGVKTTNAKARAFQTPAPLQPRIKPEKTLKKASTARRSVKSKIRVALSEPVETDLLSKEPESDVPDVEYCPPPPIGLPDPPEDITYDDNFPYLRGNNLCSGYSEVYDIPRDKHGVSIQERKEEEAYVRKVHEMEDQIREEMKQPWPREEEDDIVDQMIAAGPDKMVQQSSNVDTITARRAVFALSSQPQTRLPSVTVRETASSMQKKKANSSTREARKMPLQPTNPSVMRHNAAVAASKTTLGYSKGRSVLSSMPEKNKSRKIDQSEIHPRDFRKLYGEPPMGSKMWDRFRIHGLFDEETEIDEEDLAGRIWRTGIYCDEEAEAEADEIFQLPMPE